MNVTLFGTGYVGLVTGTCLAEVGNDVICVDIDAARIAALQNGEIPLFEPDLHDMVRTNSAAGRLRFSGDAQSAIDHAEIIFIAVGTPSDEDGSADMRHVLAVAATIGTHLAKPTLIVNKSTVPVGTAEQVQSAIRDALAARGSALTVDVVANPEFLKEGNAVKDCMRPDRIVIGARDAATAEPLRRLYAPFNRNHERVVLMDVRSAELTKYAANAMLATKISFMNEMANIAERVGADIEMVRQGIGSDPRIGYHFIYPGAGYGGSCFPKDVRALGHTARQHGYVPALLGAVEAVNDAQKDHLFTLINAHFAGRLAGRCFALWGLAFKPDTDDMREAPSRRLLERLWAAGASVRAHDPEAMDEAARLYGPREDLVLCDTPDRALQGADALILITEWKAFWSPDFERIRANLRQPVVFDGRNVYAPEAVEAAGLQYYGIGRGRSVTRP